MDIGRIGREKEFKRIFSREFSSAFKEHSRSCEWHLTLKVNLAQTHEIQQIVILYIYIYIYIYIYTHTHTHTHISFYVGLP